VNRHRAHFLLFLLSLIVACLLQLMPLPDLLLPFRPYWLGLILVYWTLEEPERIGLGRAFLLGLVGDVLQGDLLGDQALRLAALAFIVLRFRARLRFFPMWQQSLAVFALLLNDRVLSLMERTFTGDPLPPLSFWYAPVAGMLAWPWVFLLFDDLRARLRVHEA
jgi:rod shape-determining protein MreD